MSLNVTIIESTSPNFPAALQTGTLIPPVAQLWVIGNLDILKTPLLGLFCSTRCPGNVILRTYDLALALREAEVPIISGFHTPMEKECLEVFLRGTQPIVLCPARDIQHLRLPAAWRKPLADGRLLILSSIAAAQRRPPLPWPSTAIVLWRHWHRPSVWRMPRLGVAPSGCVQSS